ncbi:MAG: hypothetical protein R3246_12835, partial [Acidimicrobiia bacterium]|nr:hypothetical protein [Acidimicrobiia bacterium]
MLSAGSIERLEAIDSNDFPGPGIYSIAVWLVTRVWSSPAGVTLLQVAAMVVLLDVFVRRAVGIGVPRWLARAVVVVFAWLPAVGSATIALEPQTAQALVGIWILVELMALAPDPKGYLADPWAQGRFGGAIASAWLLDQGGVVVVVVIAVGLVVGVPKRELALVPLGGALALALLVLPSVFAGGTSILIKESIQGLSKLLDRPTGSYLSRVAVKVTEANGQSVFTTSFSRQLGQLKMMVESVNELGRQIPSTGITGAQRTKLLEDYKR